MINLLKFISGAVFIVGAFRQVFFECVVLMEPVLSRIKRDLLSCVGNSESVTLMFMTTCGLCRT
jgi:hypothetical protein